MKKSSSIILVIVAIIVVGAGGYALVHKSNDKTSTTTPAKQSTSQSSAPAVNNAVLVTKTDSKLGQYLADPSGKALYTYGADSSGVSNCTGSCIATWPAYQDTGSTTNLPAGIGTIKRSDNGQTQYTYNGRPLYFFVSDGKGQVTGDGVDNFKIAKPAAASSTNSSSGSSSSSSSTDNSSSSSSPSYSY